MIKTAKTRSGELPLTELIEDMSLYPRSRVDEAHVGNLYEALAAGNTLPAIVVDAKSKRITDGWHRVRAYRRFLGDDADVPVELIAYKSEADMIYDAVRRNSAHGRRLDRVDRQRAIHMLEMAKYDATKISVALQMTPAKIEHLRVKVATSRTSTMHTIPGTRSISLKPSCQHMAGETLTKAQAEEHQSAPGTSYTLIARQLLGAVRVGLIDRENDKLMSLLKQLHEELSPIVG